MVASIAVALRVLGHEHERRPEALAMSLMIGGGLSLRRRCASARLPQVAVPAAVEAVA